MLHCIECGSYTTFSMSLFERYGTNEQFDQKNVYCLKWEIKVPHYFDMVCVDLFCSSANMLVFVINTCSKTMSSLEGGKYMVK